MLLTPPRFRNLWRSVSAQAALNLSRVVRVTCICPNCDHEFTTEEEVELDSPGMC